MKLRDGLGRTGCALGRHGGAWTWAADESCDQTRECPHCGKVRSRTEHTLTGWSYADPDDTASCLMERRCPRCGLTERSVHHEPRWRYDTDGRCAGQRFCERCGTPSGERGTRHEWGPWLTDRDAARPLNPLALRTQLARTCRRCDERESRS